MTKNRLEAFSDGVLAIVITIMVLELKAPHDASILSLKPLFPVFLSYVLSFIYVAIYWNNHHHLLHAAERISGGVMWANMGLLFALSLVPFATAWMGENHFASFPVALYGLVLLAAALAYTILVRSLLRIHSAHSALARAIGGDLKGNASLILYLAAIVLALFFPWVAGGLYLAVALIWLVPDKRIEKAEGR
jgi:uncharacterized membrane protein